MELSSCARIEELFLELFYVTCQHIVNQSSKRSVASTVFYDDSGFPLVGGSALDAAECPGGHLPEPKVEHCVADPAVKRKKKAVQSQKIAPKKVAQSSASPPKLENLPLTKPVLSGPTKEANSRCELCAYVVVDGRPKRVHIFTLTRNGAGPDFEQMCQD